PPAESVAPPATTARTAPPPAPPQNRTAVSQWQRACQERLAWAKRMVDEGRNRCPISGMSRQNCLDYYQGLDIRYQGISCSANGGGMPMPGW
ncbi:MAG: hypothetical protein HQM02_11980, partial [Magnetococcales bacterium]|nr:hypothetical protein [Magnetococcales bacterium]